MKELFRKLVHSLGFQLSGRDTESGERSSGHPVAPEVVVRTKSIYPQERKDSVRFRFPMIPDENHSTAKQRPRINHQNKEQKQITPLVNNSIKPETITNKTPIHNHVNMKTKNIIPAKKKGPFQPTQMVSPVHGILSVQLQPEAKEEKRQPHQPLQPNHASHLPPSPFVRQSIETKQQGSDLPNLEEAVEQKGDSQRQSGMVSSPIRDEEIGHDFSTEERLNEENAADQIRHSNTVAADEHLDGRKQTISDPEVGMRIPLFEQRQDHLPGKQHFFHNDRGNSYILPGVDYLKQEPAGQGINHQHTEHQMEKLSSALKNFNVKAEIIGVVVGPSVTRYEIQPAPGVKVNKFTTLIDDFKLALAAKDIRMEAPIPGRSAIGIEVPNDVSSPVYIRSIIESDEFRSHPSPLAVALGRDISGQPVIGDLKKMPHGLIAGATGSGKSVCINSMIISLLYKASPYEVRLILVDPKVVELAPYNHIPHLLTPVVTDPKQATAALKWAVEEMDRRYEMFAETGVRDIDRYNCQCELENREKLPFIVIVIDELADLMMVAPHEVEESICRIAQKARACGIHLLVATQRPSVDVITGLIKANIPTRIAFAVSSQADSRTTLDMAGAERLLGKGDMLYYPSGLAKPLRLQGNFVSDDEIEQVVAHVKQQQKVQYLFDKEDLTKVALNATENEDELFEEALLFVIEQGQASSSSLQRRFRIGYNRAARLVDLMEAEGFISAQSGSKPRDVLITIDEYHKLFG